MPISTIMDGVDFASVTHSHFDHFYKPASKALADSIKMYIQPADSVAFKNEYGFENIEIITDSIIIDGITTVRTSGIHGNGEIGLIMGAVSGFILKEQGNPTDYIFGDCLYTPEIKANIEKYHPEWVIPNSGGAIGLPLSMTDGRL